jgi:two-component system, chemotaxis family, protein-glutamate methylesterase/glutaminase
MNNTNVRVLIVDDSAFARKVFMELLSSREGIEVVGTARNGLDALEKTAELRPDVVLLDVFMPELDAIGYLRVQMKLDPLPVILVSSAGEDEEKVVEAIETGAVDFIQKPTAKATEKIYSMAGDLIDKVMAVSSIPRSRLSIPNGVISKLPPVDFDIFKPTYRIKAVVIGVSTGGPQTLRTLLPAFPRNFPVPMAVVLHMPVGYTQSLASRLNDITDLETLEADEGVEMRPGRIIIGKAGYHMVLMKGRDEIVRCHLKSSTFEKGLYCPSADLLFQSAAEVYGPKTLGVILTGMGNDGTAGAARIKAAGGLIYTESEESAVIYGMPRSAVEAGLSDEIIPLNKMVERIMETL